MNFDPGREIISICVDVREGAGQEKKKKNERKNNRSEVISPAPP